MENKYKIPFIICCSIIIINVFLFGQFYERSSCKKEKIVMMDYIEWLEREVVVWKKIYEDYSNKNPMTIEETIEEIVGD